MEKLFVYGTLMDKQVVRCLIGREVGSHRGHVHGHRCRRVEGEVYPGVVRSTDPSDSVQGYVLEEMTQRDLHILDVYEGEQIPAGKKSLAYHLTFLSPSKTLTDRDVRKQRTRILKQVERTLGATLRD